jgi:hypothetical protein
VQPPVKVAQWVQSSKQSSKNQTSVEDSTDVSTFNDPEEPLSDHQDV